MQVLDWSEPHGHIDELNVRNLYILWCICHPYAAIEIVQECVMYSNSTWRPHEKVCMSF